MSNRDHRLNTIIALLCVVFLLFAAPGAKASGEIEIYILHTNDFHGNLLPFEDKNFVPPPETVGGAAYISTVVKEYRKKYPGNIILLDAGDIAQGTPISNMTKGKLVVEYMNYLRYDAMTIGNHEFDWGRKGLEDIIKWADFPVLGGNIILEKRGELLPEVKPYLILERSGLRIGIIGVTTPDTARMTFPGNVEGLKFTDPCACVRKYLKELKEKGLKVIVLLSHLGFNRDQELAKEVPGITLIVGGHSHTAVRATEKVNDTLIVQAGSTGNFLGCLRLRLDKSSGEVLFYNVEQELIPIIDSEIEPDKEVEAMIEPYAKNIRPVMDEVIGKADCDIVKIKYIGLNDTPIGNLITDAIRMKYDADIAIYNLGGIRTSIHEGEITRGDIFNLLPFDNHIITMELSGADIIGLLNYFASHRIGIQLSGIKVRYMPQAQKGEMIQDTHINGKPVEEDKRYKLATLDFIYYSLDDSTPIKRGKNITYGAIARDILEEYIRENKVITAPMDPRILVEK